MNAAAADKSLQQSVRVIANELAQHPPRTRVLLARKVLEVVVSEHRAVRRGGLATFSDDEVREYRRRAQAGEGLCVRDLARAHGISGAGFYAMLNGNTYKHVK